METKDSLSELRKELAELMEESDRLLVLLGRVRERIAVVLGRLSDNRQNGKKNE
jgi:hypothetical protein